MYVPSILLFSKNVILPLKKKKANMWLNELSLTTNNWLTIKNPEEQWSLYIVWMQTVDNLIVSSHISIYWNSKDSITLKPSHIVGHQMCRFLVKSVAGKSLSYVKECCSLYGDKDASIHSIWMVSLDVVNMFNVCIDEPLIRFEYIWGISN